MCCSSNRALGNIFEKAMAKHNHTIKQILPQSRFIFYRNAQTQTNVHKLLSKQVCKHSDIIKVHNSHTFLLYLLFRTWSL